MLERGEGRGSGGLDMIDGRFIVFAQDDLPVSAVVVVVVVVVSHIQRIGCQPEKTTSHGGQSRSWSAEQGKKEKEKVGQRTPPPPLPRALLVRRKNKKNRKSRGASTCLGATQAGVTQVVSVRLASVQGFLRLVS